MKVEITVSSDELNDDHMVIDFGVLKKEVMKFMGEFDHSFLANEKDKKLVEDYEDVFGRAHLFPFDPTAEALASYFFTRLIRIIDSLKDDAQNLLVLEKITVWESETAKAEYTQ
jgi:6-pyruvoyl-tetrahydropterin synthase